MISSGIPRIWSIILLIIASGLLVHGQKRPEIEELTLVSQVPIEIPQRIFGMAYDGEKLWLSISHDKGHYATFNPHNAEWKYSNNESHRKVIREISQPFNSPSGMAFNGKTLWLGGSYGESLGSINLETWQIDKHFTGKLRPDLLNSQVYSSLAYDGKNLWAAWHMFEYKRPVSESQQLLKIDQASGVVLERYPLPAGMRANCSHGLTFDGEMLWHIKEKKLSAIDLRGQVLSQFIVKKLSEPTGLAWDGHFLWIVEFSGKVWKLPLK